MQKSLKDILPEEFVEKRQEEYENPELYKPEIEDVIEAEFLMKFGWESYWAIHPEFDRNIGINGKEMTRLISASRKIDAQNLYRDMQASYVGSVTSQAKNPSNAFISATKRVLRMSEV